MRQAKAIKGEIKMTIIKEQRLEDFEFRSGASYMAERVTSEEFGIIENYLEELYPDGMDEEQINDFFWFEGDTIAQILGYEDEDDMMKNRR